MSKVGRKPIDLGALQVEVKGHAVHYKGSIASGVYELPALLKAEIADKKLTLVLTEGDMLDKDNKMVLGLHRSRLANILQGADKKFEKVLKINGLGFKVVKKSDKELQFSLGFSHKIDTSDRDIDLTGVDFEIDKTGQVLTMRSADKEKLGLVCSQIRFLREPEPYKGTGIQYMNETILRKVGKAK
jgi:large subunit ribosomal protein L6